MNANKRNIIQLDLNGYFTSIEEESKKREEEKFQKETINNIKNGLPSIKKFHLPVNQLTLIDRETLSGLTNFYKN